MNGLNYLLNMNRFWNWLFSRDTEHGSRGTVVDLPAEFGPWLSIEEMRRALRGEGSRAAVTSMVQLMWYYHGEAAEAARIAADTGKGNAGFELGKMDAVVSVLADFEVLRKGSDAEVGRLREKFERGEA